ncbi:MAG TPA: dTDP-4-dehydrorhamnose reductase [Chlamydiales bacterium]|nr:dTDP-4-dehydrorhamnose reductase [Chlamydiales bacterium]
MKLWITGAAGLVGSSLKKYAHLATDKHEADISSLESLRSFVYKNRGITHIVNCAAFSLVDLAETHRKEAFRANAEGPENLGILANEMGARVIHLSTDYVFPGHYKHPLKEDDPTDPGSYYGLTKLEGEQRLVQVHQNACIIRPSWIFGRGGKNFVAKLLEMFREKEEIRLTDDQWGRPTFAPDLTQIILKMLDASGIYHFANRGAANKYEFGCAMLKKANEMGFPITTKKIVPVPASTFPSPAIRPAYSVFDTSKIEKYLDVAIRPWEEALGEHLCAAL